MRDFNSLSHASLSPSGHHNPFIHCTIPSDVPLPSSIFLLPVCLLLFRGVSPANLPRLTPSGLEHFDPLPRVQAVTCWALMCRASRVLLWVCPIRLRLPKGGIFLSPLPPLLDLPPAWHRAEQEREPGGSTLCSPPTPPRPHSIPAACSLPDLSVCSFLPSPIREDVPESTF